MPPVTVASVEVGGCTVRRRGALAMVRTVRVMATVTKEQENVSATQDGEALDVRSRIVPQTVTIGVCVTRQDRGQSVPTARRGGWGKTAEPHVMDCRSQWTVESVCATVVVIMESLVRTLAIKLEFASTTVVNVKTRPRASTRAGGESSVRRRAVLGI